MAAKERSYRTRDGDEPTWASEPFRVFFPLGIGAGVFGLLLWPLHYLGWWELYPAVQHPRLLIFGFGAAFVFGFLGTAFPRFLESRSLTKNEVSILAALWGAAQAGYATGYFRSADCVAAFACLFLIAILAKRLSGETRELPPPGFAVAFLALVLACLVLVGFALEWNFLSPWLDHLLRLAGYQGFLLLPVIGVGSYLFPRFFGPGGIAVSPARRSFFVWAAALLILISLGVEAAGWVRGGNALRLLAVLGWAFGAVPILVRGKSPGTKAWALRCGLAMMAFSFAPRIAWPTQVFAFEHLLFLGGFTQVILLVADRVATGHSKESAPVSPRSLRWRWIVWLMILAAATRATADLVPTTRVSHHIYAALTVTMVLALWWGENWRRIRT